MMEANDSDDDLKFKNELEKLKMQAELGAGFFETQSDMPPELEAAWLKNVRAFEENYENVVAKPIKEILGNPVLKSISEITEENADTELATILAKMEEKGIILDHDTDVPATELYRFVVEEMMDHEAEIFDMPGWQTHLIYEEFHPNHEKDIFKTCDKFCHNLFDRKDDLLTYDLDKELVFSNGTMLLKDEFIEKAKLWFDAHDSFTINRLGYMQPKFDMEQEMGHIDFFIDYDAHFEGGGMRNYTGPGIFYVHYNWTWNICGMDFPGFKEWALE